MGMKEDNDEVTTKTRILSLELLQVSSAGLSVHLKTCSGGLVERGFSVIYLSIY